MELDLDAIEARANAATEGPWWRREGHAEIDGQNYAEVLIPGRVECGSYCYGGTSTIEGDRLDADLAFIAHARADVPDLVAEVRRLRAEAEVDAGLIRSIIAAREHVERTLTAERDDARAAIAAVEDMCNEWQLNAAAPTTRGHCADVVREVIDHHAALDVRRDPSATTTIPSDVAKEHAWLANYALEMLVDTGDGTYHPIADALAKVRDLLDPSEWRSPLEIALAERDDARAAIARVRALDPADHATSSRDYGRGYAQAIRDIRAAIDGTA